MSYLGGRTLGPKSKQTQHSMALSGGGLASWLGKSHTLCRQLMLECLWKASQYHLHSIHIHMVCAAFHKVDLSMANTICHLPRMLDENPDSGAFIGIWTWEGGTIQECTMAQEYLTSMCNQIGGIFFHSFQDSETSLAMCA